MSESSAPLTAAMFNVMLALSDGDKHGYAILKDVAAQTNGEVQLSTGTLYGIVKRLLNEGMIVELRRRPAVEDDDSRRRYYHLTSFGRRILAADVARLEELVRAAKSHLRAPNPRRAT